MIDLKLPSVIFLLNMVIVTDQINIFDFRSQFSKIKLYTKTYDLNKCMNYINYTGRYWASKDEYNNLTIQTAELIETWE